jgi:uncharacterized Zn-binding protein involved in type VI secretion
VSLKSIAVDGCTLKESAGSGTISITNSPSSKVKCDGKGAYYDKIEIEISSYTGKNIINGDGSGSGSIKGGSKSVKIEGKPAVLEDDESETITVKGTKPGPNGSKIPTTDDITVKVQKAGQSKDKGA